MTMEELCTQLSENSRDCSYQPRPDKCPTCQWVKLVISLSPAVQQPEGHTETSASERSCMREVLLRGGDGNRDILVSCIQRTEI